MPSFLPLHLAERQLNTAFHNLNLGNRIRTPRTFRRFPESRQQLVVDAKRYLNFRHYATLHGLTSDCKGFIRGIEIDHRNDERRPSMADISDTVKAVAMGLAKVDGQMEEYPFDLGNGFRVPTWLIYVSEARKLVNQQVALKGAK
jgi:hypothetical protein